MNDLPLKCPDCFQMPAGWLERPAYGSREIYWIGCKKDVRHLAGGITRGVAIQNWNRLVTRRKYELTDAIKPMRLGSIVILLFISIAVHADGPRLSANPYAPDSTSNPYGIYGSHDSPISANNPYGQGIQVTAPRPRAQVTEQTINVWSAPAPHDYDFSGLSRLEFENGHPVVSEDKPAKDVAELKEAMPEPHQNIIDALDEIRHKGGVK